MKAAALKPKLYVYAIVPRLDDRILGPIGLDTSTVHSITGGSLSAFVSEIAGRFRPERRHLAAHQEVLRQLMDVAPAVLPVAFGMVAEDGKVMHRILSRNQRSLREQLERVHGRVEMGLRVTWDVPNIFEYFVATHEELRVTRDRFFGGHREPMQDDKIEVGRLFDRLLREDRETHGARVEDPRPVLRRHQAQHDARRDRGLPSRLPRATRPAAGVRSRRVRGRQALRQQRETGSIPPKDSSS